MTRAGARWGCFLPDLTRLASGSSTTNLPRLHIVRARAKCNPPGAWTGSCTGRPMPVSALDPRLQSDTLPVAQLSLSALRLMNDRRWPWVVLVPRRDTVELYELTRKDRILLMEEIAEVSAALKRVTRTEKINVGSLGNLVPQLHVHLVGRSKSDPAWPGPVWGFGTAEPYPPADAEALVQRLRDAVVLP